MMVRLSSFALSLFIVLIMNGCYRNSGYYMCMAGGEIEDYIKEHDIDLQGSKCVSSGCLLLSEKYFEEMGIKTKRNYTLREIYAIEVGDPPERKNLHVFIHLEYNRKISHYTFDEWAEKFSDDKRAFDMMSEIFKSIRKDKIE